MKITPRIEEVNLHNLQGALALLIRFFQEHGITARGGELRSPLEAMITDPASAVFLCRAGGVPAGVVTVTSSIGLEYGRSAEIEDLYVTPEARGQGFGDLLVERALAWCRTAGCSAVLVTVVPQGQAGDRLLDFYEKHSFQLTGRRLLECSL